MTKTWALSTTSNGDWWDRVFGPKQAPKGKPVREIHISDVNVFLTCRRRWKYSSRLRMGYEAALPNMNLWLGRQMHAALAHWYATSSPKETLEYFDEICGNDIEIIARAEVGEKFLTLMNETMELGYAVLRHYILHSRRIDEFDVEAIEQPMAVLLPFVENAAIVSRLDLVGRDKKGQLFVMDHKTTSRMPDIRYVRHDMQAPTYTFMAGAWSGEPVQNFTFNFLLKKQPSIPSVLKNGTLSRAKLHQTSYEVYGHALAVAGHSWDQYTDVLFQLRDQPNGFFRRDQLKFSHKALQVHISHLCSIATDMLDPNTPLYPSPDRFSCRWCDFVEPCIMETHGADPEPLLRANYIKRGANGY